MELHPAVAETIQRLANLIQSVSTERWLMEMDKLLVGKGAARVLGQMGSLLNFMIPEVLELKKIVNQGTWHTKDAWLHTLKVVEQAPATPDLRWAALWRGSFPEA
jgi:poly(A) polymerase